MFRNTGANAFAKNQMRLAYEYKRDLYCSQSGDFLDRAYDGPFEMHMLLVAICYSGPILEFNVSLSQ